MCLIALAIALGVLCAFAKSLPPTTCANGTMLASEKKNDVVITVMSQQGKLTEGNNNLDVVLKSLKLVIPRTSGASACTSYRSHATTRIPAVNTLRSRHNAALLQQARQ